MAVLDFRPASPAAAPGLLADPFPGLRTGELTWPEAVKHAAGVLAVLVLLGSFFGPALHPSITHDFPDPTVLEADGGYYAYSTQSSYLGRVLHVPVQRALAPDGEWTVQGDALPRLPPWVAPDARGQIAVWAPEVTTRWDGTYLLYFTAPAGPAARCIGAAVAGSPTGPFEPRPGPLVCQPENHDTIDPAAFTDSDGSHYLLYSNGRVGTSIWLERLAPDGLSTTGPPVALIHADRPEEGSVVEAPSLSYHDGRYVLFYSANSFDSGHYFINYATSGSLGAPFVKHPGALLAAAALPPGLSNPGGQDVVPTRDPGYLVFHAFTRAHRRSTFVVQIAWNDDGSPSLLLPRP